MMIFILFLLIASSLAYGQPQVGGVGGGGSGIISSTDQIQIECADSEIIKFNFSTSTWGCAVDASSEGSGALLDLLDDGDNESTSVNEIAVTGDANGIFTESSADKLTILVGQNWPACDVATQLSTNGANCSAGQAPLGVNATGAAEGCYDVATQTELDTASSALTTHASDITDVHGLNIVTPSDAHILVYDNADSRFENIAMTGDVAITSGGVTAVSDNSHNHTVSNLSNVSAGSDLTADLEEEAHATEHQENGDDELLIESLGTACTEGQLIVPDATGGLVCGESSNPVTGGVTLTMLADCSTETDVGALCVDSTTGVLHFGDDEEAVPVGSGGAGGGETLDATFDLGPTIDGATALNPLTISDGTDGFRIFVDTGGPVIECFIGEGACDIVRDIPSGNSDILKYNGTTGITIDSSGEVTLSNNMIEYKSMWFGAGTLSTDGTQCGEPAERTINSGPKTWVVNCADNNGSILYGSVTMPDSYDGGTVHFLLVAENENATPSGVLDFDFSAMCRSDSDTLNSTWGTAVNSALTFTTQYDVEMFWSTSVTPNGTCAAGDTLFWRAVMDATSTTTQVANTYVIGVKMEYPTNDWSDN